MPFSLYSILFLFSLPVCWDAQMTENHPTSSRKRLSGAIHSSSLLPSESCCDWSESSRLSLCCRVVVPTVLQRTSSTAAELPRENSSHLSQAPHLRALPNQVPKEEAMKETELLALTFERNLSSYN